MPCAGLCHVLEYLQFKFLHPLLGEATLNLRGRTTFNVERLSFYRPQFVLVDSKFVVIISIQAFHVGRYLCHSRMQQARQPSMVGNYTY
jgi:hypothetical protein